MKPCDVINIVEKWTGHALHEDEYITFGSSNAELSGITVTWMINPQTIAAAAEIGHNCIIHHEALTYPYPYFTTSKERQYLNWPINVQRLRLLAKYGITTIRIHGSADEVCIFDAFANQLGLGKAIVGNDSNQYLKTFGAPVATFGELVKHVKKAVGMAAVRATRHDPNRPVRQIGLPWGGMGLFVNVDYMQNLIDLGVDTLICGETDNYGFRFADEVGLAVIETSHEISEEKGLQEFAKRLQTALGIDVRFTTTPCVWQMA